MGTPYECAGNETVVIVLKMCLSRCLTLPLSWGPNPNLEQGVTPRPRPH